jgi:hypothetical protein
VKNIATLGRVRVSADGHGVVSHAGMGMVRELVDLTALSVQVTAVLADTYRGVAQGKRKSGNELIFVYVVAVWGKAG